MTNPQPKPQLAPQLPLRITLPATVNDPYRWRLGPGKYLFDIGTKVELLAFADRCVLGRSDIHDLDDWFSRSTGKRLVTGRGDLISPDLNLPDRVMLGELRAFVETHLIPCAQQEYADRRGRQGRLLSRTPTIITANPLYLNLYLHNRLTPMQFDALVWYSAVRARLGAQRLPIRMTKLLGFESEHSPTTPAPTKYNRIMKDRRIQSLAAVCRAYAAMVEDRMAAAREAAARNDDRALVHAYADLRVLGVASRDAPADEWLKDQHTAGTPLRSFSIAQLNERISARATYARCTLYKQNWFADKKKVLPDEFDCEDVGEAEEADTYD